MRSFTKKYGVCPNCHEEKMIVTIAWAEGVCLNCLPMQPGDDQESEPDFEDIEEEEEEEEEEN